MALTTAQKRAGRAGDYGPHPVATAPVGGTTEVLTLTIGGTPSGNLTFTHKGRSATAAWSATNATLVANIDAALESLPSIGTGGITTATGTMTNGVGTITLTYAGNNVKKNMAVLTVAATLTVSGTSALAVTTPGVDATLRGLPKGAAVVAMDTGVWYANTGTDVSPTFTVIGSQS